MLRKIIGVWLGLLIAATSLVVTGAAAQAQTLTVTPTNDTYVQHDRPDTAFGSSVRWSVQGTAGFERASLLRFNVTAPAGEHITSATLRAYSETTTTASQAVDVYGTTGSWSEGTVTWNTAPARGTLQASASGFASGSWVQWDVTDYVGTGGFKNFRLETAAGNPWIGFKSKENTDPALAPQIVITTAPDAPSGDGTTAAATFGWGSPVAGDEFNYTGAPDSTKWGVYDSAGHNGNGLRRPSQVAADGSKLTISGTAAGTTGGVEAKFARQQYGRWETRARAAGDNEYHMVGILWPDSGNWPCDGEIDYFETTGSFSAIDFFQHYSCSNLQTHTSKAVDVTQFHNYAVQWTPAGVIGYLDGVEWFRDTDPSHLPPGPMHQTLQLDWFPDATTNGTATMDVDWVRVYNAGSTPPPAGGPSFTLTSPAAGATVSGPVTLDGTSSDAAQVAYFIDGVKVAEDLTCCTWDEVWDSASVTNGAHSLTAVATNAGGSTTTPARTITVNNPTPPPPACGDGVDNDGDGKIDYPADTGCTSATDADESNPLPPAGGDVTLAAVGDMNPSGNTSTTSASGKNAAAIIAGLGSGAYNRFLALGDFQYDKGTCAALNSQWKSLWGGTIAKLYPTFGPNHDVEPGVNDEADVFLDGGCAGSTTRSAADTDPTVKQQTADGFIDALEAYSYDVGNWHVVVAPTALLRYGTTAQQTAATTWIDNDLAAAKAAGKFLAAVYHDPYFTGTTSSHGPETTVKPWVDLFYKHRVRVTLSGSQHNYERTCPISNAGQCVTDGMTAFQVSTGGIGLRTFTSSPAYVVRQFTDTWGFLELTLKADGSFSWNYKPTSGGMQTDSGSRTTF